MSDTDVELGPVDYVVVAFPAGQAHFSGEMASELVALKLEMPLFGDRSDRPGLIGRLHDRRDDRGDRREDRQDDRGDRRDDRDDRRDNWGDRRRRGPGLFR